MQIRFKDSGQQVLAPMVIERDDLTHTLACARSLLTHALERCSNDHLVCLRSTGGHVLGEIDGPGG